MKRSRRWAIIVIFLVLFLCFPSCSIFKPRYIDRWHTEYVINNVHHRDTIITKDSVYIREWMKGDTIYLEKYRDRYVYRDRWRDSISVREVHDTTTVEKKVEKPLSWAQKAKLDLFPWLLGIAIILGLWTTKKWWLPLLR